MAYLCYCIDVPNSSGLRQHHLQAHLAYIESIIDKIAIAGPLREHQDAAPSGSCFIFHTQDHDEALQLLKDDPYFRAGIWSQTRCEHFTAAAGSWVGGTNW